MAKEFELTLEEVATKLGVARYAAGMIVNRVMGLQGNPIHPEKIKVVLVPPAEFHQKNTLANDDSITHKIEDVPGMKIQDKTSYLDYLEQVAPQVCDMSIFGK